MKEIKYKAWHKEEKKMYDVAMMDLLGKRLMLTEEGKKQIVKQSIFDAVELLEFTGKTDKGKKKLFKGDLVKWLDGKNYEIKWSDKINGFVPVEVGEKENEYDYFTDFDNGEYVGNIFKNPELLTGNSQKNENEN